MKTNKVKYYTDAGHGWIAVKKSTLERLGIMKQISNFSFIKGQTVYLEEDRDARLFIAKAEHRSEYYTIIEVSHGDSSPIRNYPRVMNGNSKYSIIETIDGVDSVLFETNNLFQAETFLTYYLNHGHDAYLKEIK
jgi:hypothetical protein